MFLWSEESRAWSQKAAQAATYHAKQAKACLPYLEDVKTIADLGCGMGHLAMELARLGKKATGVDTDDTCLAMARAEAEQRGIANVDYMQANAFDLPKDTAWDAVVTCNFGDMAKDFEKFYLLANKAILAFVGRADDTPLIPGLERRKKRNAEEVAKGLEAKDCNFSSVDCDFEFGQPFDDMDEAKAFVTHYSQGKIAGKELDAFLEERLMSKDKGLYLPHTKRMTLFCVRIGTSFWDSPF